MDKVIQRKKWNSRRLLLVIGLPILLIVLVILAMSSREKSFRAERSKLSFAEVEYRDFQDMISFRATLEPRVTIQLNSTEGGMVEELFAEDGMMVEKGQALLRVSNPSLRLDFMNRETQIVEQVNNLRSTRITLDQNKRQVQEQLIDLNYQLKEQIRQFAMDSSLFVEEVISTTDFKASEALLVYLQEKQALLNERLAVDEMYRQSQLGRIDVSVEMMERNLEAIRSNLENLVLKAPISGQLNSFDHEIGQMKLKGENLGRVDILDDYLLSAQVDQYHLNRMKVGHSATALFSGRAYSLVVKKIFSTVVNGQFEVQLSFVDQTLPPNIRRGQNVQVRLELSATKKALLLPRGAYSQSNGGKYVYVLSGDDAERREVNFGNQNPEHIEILEGLAEGERIISSSYEQFGEAQKIVLTQ